MWAIVAIIILGILLMLILRNERRKEILHQQEKERARIEKLVEAFMRTVLPDPEKTGEQLGSWVLSRLGTKRK
jgi:hypothetical protein